MSLQNREVAMFRCHIDPNIPPKARNAFVMGDKADQLPGTAELTTVGVLVKTEKYGDYLIPFSNLQCIKFEPEALPIQNAVNKGGRPRKDQSEAV